MHCFHAVMFAIQDLMRLALSKRFNRSLSVCETSESAG